ncbi:lytic transglycosylase domain-containing protein [Sphingomonas abietis]|uniref:Lytic transglycosylase domain-containing protein n=1 Tax=Sphingomonas abietis TaxID=3012344 RepID=A0ABY7NWJ1_9SPHN|nr:lytic transglycosylase domain-containing protein [Sphingomonas abietis]WBO23781.1 lytic transglycosylase domain-containing protein [Sphingomonas abietis]
MQKFIIFLAWGLLVPVMAVGARADVYQIDDQGAVYVRHMSGDVQWGASGAGRDAGSDQTPSDAAFPDTGMPASAMTLLAAPQVPDAWRPSLLAAASRYGISSDLLAALVWQESRWRPGALSPKGAMGLAQLMPATARALAVDAQNPAANLAGGAQYLRRMLDLFDGDVERALAAYNAGPGRVQRAGGVPAIAETRAYVSNILLHMAPAAVGETGIPK